MPIREIGKISITILMDNSTDLLLKNSVHALRSPLIMNERLNLPPPVAEHGFSALINIDNDHDSSSSSSSSSNCQDLTEILVTHISLTLGFPKTE
jgi:hypothetical protein